MKFEAALSIWLNHTEQSLVNNINQGNMPFLGGYLDFLNKNSRQYFKKKLLNTNKPLQTFLFGLKHWPAVFTTYLTIFIVEGYGQDGNAAVWPYIDKALNSLYENSLSHSENKKKLWKAYRVACIKIGLPVLSRKSGSQYMVNEFLHQAGVPLMFIPGLAEYMVKYAISYGLPEESDTYALKQWRLGLLKNMRTLQKPVLRAIETDDTDYFPQLFLQYFIHGDKQTSNTLEEAFHDKLIEIQDNQSLVTNKLFKIPEVIWRDENICIEIPASEFDDWEISIDGTISTYTGLPDNQIVTFASELPLNIEVKNISNDQVQIWDFKLWKNDANNRFLLFDEKGNFICSCSLADTKYHLEPNEYKVLSRFIPNGYDHHNIQEISAPPSPSLYFFTLKLLPSEQTELSKGPATVILQADSKPILTWHGSHAKGVRGNELFASAKLSIQLQIPEELQEQNDDFFIKLSVNHDQDNIQEFSINILNNIIDIPLEENCRKWGAGLIRLTVSVYRDGNSRALVRNSAYVWNGLKTITRPHSFEFDSYPNNLNLDDSENIEHKNNILTFKDRNKRFFHSVFDLGNTNKRQISFTWVVPGTFLYLEEYTKDGFTEKPLSKGSLISIQEGSRKTLKIFSDTSGTLRFGDFSQHYSFRQSRYKRIPLLPLIDYIQPDSNILYFQPDDCNEPERLLHLTSPQFVTEFNTLEDNFSYQIVFNLAKYAEEIKVIATNLITGEKLSNSIIANDPNNILFAKNSLSFLSQPTLTGTVKHTLNIPLVNWRPGAWILDFKIKAGSRWYSLSNQREDTYSVGFLLSGGNIISVEAIFPSFYTSTETELLTCFKQVHEALLKCYAEESWESIKWLKKLWGELGKTLSISNTQTLIEFLRLSVRRPSESMASNWIPLCSLNGSFVEIYTLSTNKYDSLLNESHLTLKILYLMSNFSESLTSLFMKGVIHQIAATGFSNVIGMNRGEEPQDFSISTYKEALSRQNLTGRLRLLSQEDWQPSEGQYLGALHYYYTLKKMQESYLQTLGDNSADIDAGNHWRRGYALRLLKEMSHYKIDHFVEGTPAHWTSNNAIQDLGLLNTEIDNDKPQEVENLRLIVAGLSLLAQICRWEPRKSGVLEGFKSEAKQLIGVNSGQLEHILGYLFFIGEDVFSFYLLLWEFLIKADENATT